MTMIDRIKRFCQEGKMRILCDRIRASMGLKFLLAVTGVIALLMVLGTTFVTKMIVDYQYKALERRGREIGTILGKASVDRLITNDIAPLNMLVSDLVKSEDIIALVVETADGVAVTTARTSFNRENAELAAVLAAEKSEDVVKLLDAVRKKLSPIEVSEDIMLSGAKLGEVLLLFSRARVKANAWKVVFLLSGTGLMIIVTMAGLVYIMVRRMIVAPTSSAETVTSKIASGDLTQLVNVQSVDELGRLGQGINKMAAGLKGMIGNVRDAALKTEEIWGEVKEISSEIAGGSKVQAEAVEESASSVNEMHFSLKEIAGNVEDLYKTSERTSSSVIEMAASIDEVARTMVELSSSIEETSTAITQMSTAVRQIAENIEVLSSAAEDTAASATEISASVREVESNAKESASLAEAVAEDAQQLGMKSIEKTIEGMSRLEATARRTADVINRLGERAENVGSILTVIEDVTDQTGLLALNAAILAAQAGEHGKGFAVVAAEIRELASRTAASTKEISTLISSVQEESREAVGVMREEVSMVEEGVRLAREAGNALQKILERADLSRNMSRSINKAAAEQARGIRQVSEAVDKINQMTHQIARATKEQKTGSEQIARASEKMRELTRFVRNSTDEQAKGGKDISAAVENMTGRIGVVNRAAGEVQSGSDLIVKAIDRIKEIAKSNADLASGLNVAMDVMAKLSTTLKKEIEQFKTGQEGTRNLLPKKD
jgi:methyl-accepting chemotaxis protein